MARRSGYSGREIHARQQRRTSHRSKSARGSEFVSEESGYRRLPYKLHRVVQRNGGLRRSARHSESCSREMSEKPVRVAVVGLGFMGGMHIAALQSIPAAQLMAVYSRDERKLSGDLSGVGGNLSGGGGVYDFSSLQRYRN